MTALFLTVLKVSAAMGAVICVMWLLLRCFYKRCSAKTAYVIWGILALRLLLPFSLNLAAAPLHIAPDTAVYRVAAPLSDKIQPNMNALQQTEEQAPSLFTILCYVWLAGVLFLLLMQIVQYILFRKRLWRWSRFAEHAVPLELFESVKKDCGIKEKVRIRLSGAAETPLLTGIIRPVLYLPDRALPEDVVRFVFQHELMHFKRRDLWYKTVLLAARTVHWFNPAVWLLFSESSQAMECACDDTVLYGRTAEERKMYGEAILFCIKQRTVGKAVLATGFYDGMRALRKRFRNLFENAGKKRGYFLMPVLALFMLASGGAVSSARASEAMCSWELSAVDGPFDVRLDLPEGLTVKAFAGEETVFLPERPAFTIWNGSEKAGSISFSEFEQYPDVPPERYYHMVYCDFMNSSMVDWDSGYAPVRETEDFCAAVDTAAVSIPLNGGMRREEYALQAVLAYDIQLSQYIVLTFDPSFILEEAVLSGIAESVQMMR